MKTEIDHKCTNEIVCPYCGYKFSDCWEYSDSDTIQCSSCKKKFASERIISCTYNTSKLCKENGLEHDWDATRSFWCESVNKTLSYRICKVCGEHDSLPASERKIEEIKDD